MEWRDGMMEGLGILTGVRRGLEFLYSKFVYDLEFHLDEPPPFLFTLDRLIHKIFVGRRHDRRRF